VGGRRAEATGSGGRDHGDPIALPLLDHPRARRQADAEEPVRSGGGARLSRLREQEVAMEAK
jgi:hypothetical protein